jgi:hypothetical protein
MTFLASLCWRIAATPVVGSVVGVVVGSVVAVVAGIASLSSRVRNHLRRKTHCFPTNFEVLACWTHSVISNTILLFGVQDPATRCHTQAYDMHTCRLET